MKQKIPPALRIKILTDALNERYQALHKIRERVQNTSYWTLGFLITASGWIIQSNSLNIIQKVLMTLLATAGYLVIRHIYLADLHKGFVSQQAVAVRVEKTLGLYEKNIFDDEDLPIYPEEWKKSGNKNGGGKYFITNFRMIDVGIIIFLIALWSQGLI